MNCDYAIQKLLEKNLIEIAGRSDSAGKPLIYRTSGYFFEYFAINDIADLPKLQEIAIDEEEFQRQFQNFSEDNDEMQKIAEEINGTGVEEESENNTNENGDENVVSDEVDVIEAEINEESFGAGEVDFSEEASPEEEGGLVQDVEDDSIKENSEEPKSPE